MDIPCKRSEQKGIHVGKIYAHPSNWSYTDIILLELDEALDYKMGIMPICLPERVTLFSFSKLNCQNFN